MPTMNLEKILERVQELKIENEEKDEVIRVQQGQIDELETKLQAAQERVIVLEKRIEELNSIAGQAESFMEKLTEVLG